MQPLTRRDRAAGSERFTHYTGIYRAKVGLLGCGAVGGSATSDNVTVHHLYQIRRAAYGLIEPEDVGKTCGCCQSTPAPAGGALSADDIECIVQAVLRQVRGA